MTVAGLFLSHVESSRIDRHFERLAGESGGAIAWRRVLNPGGHATPRMESIACPAPEAVLPLRVEAMRRNNGVSGGFFDTVIWSCLAALDADFTWVLEYDVDFSGDWSRLFAQFTESPADLLTTTLLARPESPDWFWWRTAQAPAGIADAGMYRSVLPVMRISRRMAATYAQAMREPGWAGHYEFTLPTAAMAAGMSVEDIGGAGPLCPPERAGRNYSNTPQHAPLTPGTFVWRPSWERYFHEAPDSFPEPDMLYHPVKPDVAEWDRERFAAAGQSEPQAEQT